MLLTLDIVLNLLFDLMAESELKSDLGYVTIPIVYGGIES
jgi:hypothetical protein